MSDTTTLLESLSPHVVKLKDHERRRIAEEVAGKAHTITCPYCLIGAALIVVKALPGAQFQIPVDPVKCETCGRFFRLRPRVVIDGVPLGGVG